MDTMTSAAVRIRYATNCHPIDGMPAISADQMSDEQMEAVLAFMVTNGAVVDEGGGDAPADDAGGEEPMEGDDGA